MKEPIKGPIESCSQEADGEKAAATAIRLPRNAPNGTKWHFASSAMAQVLSPSMTRSPTPIKGLCHLPPEMPMSRFHSRGLVDR